MNLWRRKGQTSQPTSKQPPPLFIVNAEKKRGSTPCAWTPKAFFSYVDACLISSLWIQSPARLYCTDAGAPRRLSSDDAKRTSSHHFPPFASLIPRHISSRIHHTLPHSAPCRCCWLSSYENRKQPTRVAMHSAKSMQCSFALYPLSSAADGRRWHYA